MSFGVRQARQRGWAVARCARTFEIHLAPVAFHSVRMRLANDSHANRRVDVVGDRGEHTAALRPRLRVLVSDQLAGQPRLWWRLPVERGEAGRYVVRCQLRGRLAILAWPFAAHAEAGAVIQVS